MAAPVWLLSVDLQTKTASFTTGLADAARQARGSFSDIQNSAKGMGDGVQQGGTNVRAALGLIDNTIRGNHAAAMADLVREFQDTKLVMLALPFAATIGGIGAVAAIAFEAAHKVKELREEHEKITNEETKFGTAINDTFRSLDDKLLTAAKRSDELRNNHLGALRKELELIDHQSMGELMHEFDGIAKAADAVFAELAGHWYSFGIGSAGAQHALTNFKTQYDSLLSQGKDEQASDLLAGTLKSAQRVLALQKQAKDNDRVGSIDTDADFAKDQKHAAAMVALKQSGVGLTDKEIASQEQLVQALSAQVTVAQKVAALKNAEGQNAKTQTGNEAAGRASEAARQLAASQLAIAEQVIAGDRATAEAELEIQRATVAQKLRIDLDFARREYDAKVEANQRELAALNKTSNDYENQKRESQNKLAELEQQFATHITELKAKASVEQTKKDLADFEGGERAKLAATGQGSTERLAAIDASLKAAQKLHLQDTDFYRSLGTERVTTARQMAEEEAKQKAEAGKIEAENILKMGELAQAADIEQQQVSDSGRRANEARKIAEEQQAALREFQLKEQSLRAEQAALDKSGKDYENKLKALQNKEIQLIREHENQKTAIKDQATISRNQRILSAETSFEDSISRGLTNTLMRHQSFATMMLSIGDQVVSGMMENAIKSVLADDFTKERDAAAAARKAYLAGMQFPFPANIVAAPVLAAGAFASVMAFAGGTDSVPGSGKGDTTPAMLTPGEGVVPGGVMDGLRQVARNGGFAGGQSNHVHAHFAPTVHALDSTGVDKVLQKHASTFQKHIETALRKMNK